MISPEEARALFLPLHGTLGVMALIGGTGALLSPKGRPAHRWLGRIFVVGLLGASAAAVPVMWATSNLFLAGMGAFAAYMTFLGWQIARGKSQAGGLVPQAASVAMIGVGLLFAAYGAVYLAQGAMGGLVPLLMGLASAAFATGHLRWLRANRATRRDWRAVHAGAIGGGLIAGLTAFAAATLTNYVPSIPEPVIWLTPAAILAPLLRRATLRIGPARPTPPRL